MEGTNNPPPTHLPVAINRFDVGNIQMIHPIYIRNGNVEQAKSLLSRPNIPAMYHWAPIANMPPSLALSEADLFIRSAYVYAMAAAVMEPMARKAAIILGTVRAAVTTLYDITEGDLIVDERLAPLIALEVTEGRITARTTVPAAVNALPADVRAYVTANFDLTQAEMDAMTAIVQCAAGCHALQGWSLINCQHHYLIDVRDYSRKAFDLVEKQFWRSAAIRAFFEDGVDVVRDLMWDKS